MTREEAIDIIKCLAWHARPDEENVQQAIKTLEQEPFINKPCVSGGVCEHDKNKMLDKLRAEIAEYGSIWVQYEITGRRDKDIEQLVRDVLSQAKEQVLEVIDKYRAETEEENVSL